MCLSTYHLFQASSRKIAESNQPHILCKPSQAKSSQINSTCKSYQVKSTTVVSSQNHVISNQSHQVVSCQVNATHIQPRQVKSYRAIPRLLLPTDAIHRIATHEKQAKPIFRLLPYLTPQSTTRRNAKPNSKPAVLRTKNNTKARKEKAKK